MSIPIFLSNPRPYNDEQQLFLDRISSQLEKRGFSPKTLGVTEYDPSAPLTAIRRLMLESNGLITIAFKRTHIKKGKDVKNSKRLNNTWLTSPYSHIEPAMAFQLGLPVLILREKGVIADGILEPGVLGLYMPEFNLDTKSPSYLSSKEWEQIFPEWERQVRTVRHNKGCPPLLY